MEKLVNETNTAFVEVLASKAPVPGGGGVAAMIGAYGAALSQMVLNLTIGKKKYIEYEEENKSLLEKGEALSAQFLRLVDADAEAFEPLSKAYSMPKDDPDYESTMEKVTLDAIKAPMEMMQCACQTVELLERILITGSTLMVSDVGCGALCVKGALECAAMNVFINTKLLKNRDKASEINAEVDKMLSEYSVRAAKVAEAVFEKLRTNNK